MPMRVNCLVAEIGSTTTSINAFYIGSNPQYLGKGVSNTTVDTDVTIGLNKAIEDLNLNVDLEDSNIEVFASSSAAGGLKMTVSGLVYEMTVRAAKEAALNAGANIHYISAGDLDADDLKEIKRLKPSIVLVSGGTDYGEKNVAFNNLKKIKSLTLDSPVIYAGNIANHHRIKETFSEALKSRQLRIVENVYPRVDYMNIEPLRKEIYKTFEENIVHAPGMENIRALVSQSIIPTPGAVMESTILLSEIHGNVLTIDVGGATTDVHSLCEVSDEYKKYYEGEAKEKRTVEGDLGVFVNHDSVLNTFEQRELLEELNISQSQFQTVLKNYTYIPTSQLERDFVYLLTKKCVFSALDRHIGDLKKVYTSSGQKVIPEGKDLSQLNTIILTGGALIHLPNTENIIEEYINNRPNKLLPKKSLRIVKDHSYLLSSLGTLAQKHKDVAKNLMTNYVK